MARSHILVLISLVTLLPLTVNGQEPCIEGEWKCSSGLACIVQEYVCDGEEDCADASDENVDMCGKWECVSRSVNCVSNRKNQTLPYCVILEAHCDGIKDCIGGEDEINCPSRETECPPGEFVCGDGTCIPQALYCDTQKDCFKGEDEQGCSDMPNYMPCGVTQFRCTSGQCIDSLLKCDHKPDCRDRSDEDPVLCRSNIEGCPPAQFQCNIGAKCIETRDRCNGVKDCPNGEDEVEFCSQGFVNECELNTTNCQYECENFNVGYTCTCPHGYRLKGDKKTCEDINECVETPGVCSQHCQNNLAGYECSCDDDYILNKTSGVCTAKSRIHPYLIFGNKYYIRKVGIDIPSYTHISDHHKYTHVLDYMYSTQEIYYADSTPSKPTIKKMLLNGTDLGLVERNHAYGIEGIAVDWVARKLYWTNSHVKGILVSELNGSHVKVLFKDLSDQPRALAVCPQKGYAFWTDWGGVPFIGRIGMDGNGWRKVIDSGLYWPNGITIDYITSRIWWADAHLDRIEFANFDGSLRKVAAVNLAHPYALSIFEDRMYWTDWNLKQLESANKFTGKDRKQIVSSVHLPHDIHVVHPLRQAQITNPCGNNNGGCSHLCLIANGQGGRTTCACPENFILNSDKTSCTLNCTQGHFKCGDPEPACIPELFYCDGKKDCRGGQDEPTNCTNPASCQPGWFRCKHRAGCVPYWNVCDGRNNCRDKSDEDPQLCSVRQCMPYEFRCSSGQCLPRAWQCDGDKDCSDATDETPLNTECSKCKHTDFRCNNGKCIPKTWRCDWDDDCGDRSDEPIQECYNKTCDEGWQRCKTTYRCVAKNYWCNGNDDCRDNSDEDKELCQNCPTGDFQCKSGMPKCIPMRWLCDFNGDCGDKSDEDPEMCKDKYRKCSELEFRCSNNRCIRLTNRCDGNPDCSDGSDESGCDVNHTCAAGMFRCGSGQCINKTRVCDGHIDCREDAADETSKCRTQPPCTDKQFKCSNGACITKGYVCDGDNDCLDNSDETAGACNSIVCNPQSKFRCKTSLRCIPRYMVCNGRRDCGLRDESDEDKSNCVPDKPIECKPEEYRCADGTCIPTSSVCNFAYDCDDRTDEIGCVKQGNCTASNNICQGMCNQLPHGYVKCSCDPGLTPRGSSCRDINECNIFSQESCSQICTNIKRSYECSCHPGFTSIFQDKGSCILDNSTSQSPLLLYTLGSSIEGFLFRKNQHLTVALGQRDPVGLAVDTINQVAFWADRSLKKIYRSAIPSHVAELGIPQTIFPSASDQSASPEVSDIAYDWMGRNLYWAEASKKKIFVSTDDGRYAMTIVITSHFVQPTSVAVNSELGWLYWVEQGTPQTTAILYQSMNGKGKANFLVNKDLQQPNSLTIDYLKGGRIFWVDRVIQSIESIDIDGNNRNSYKVNNRPYSVAIFSDYMFFTIAKKGEINMYNKFGSGNGSKVYDNPSHMIHNIAMDHRRMYNTSVVNRCDALKCTHLCLLEPKGATCRCPDNVPLSNATYCDIPTVKPLKKPEPCSCQNHGECILIGTKPVCKCPEGVTGNICQYDSRRPSPPSIPPLPTTDVTKDFTTSGRQTKPATGHYSLLAAILAPVLIALIILGVTGIVLFYLYRTGRLGRKKSGHGEYREGMSGHDANQNAPGAEFSGPHIESPVTFTEGGVHFSNPIYDTIDKNKRPGGGQSVPLEVKNEMDA